MILMQAQCDGQRWDAARKVSRKRRLRENHEGWASISTGRDQSEDGGSCGGRDMSKGGE